MKHVEILVVIINGKIILLDPPLRPLSQHTSPILKFMKNMIMSVTCNYGH